MLRFVSFNEFGAMWSTSAGNGFATLLRSLTLILPSTNFIYNDWSMIILFIIISLVLFNQYFRNVSICSKLLYLLLQW